MSQSNDHDCGEDCEAGALDALVAAALRAGGGTPMSEMSVEKLEAAKSLLTAEDRAALGMPDARHVRRLVEEQLRDRALRSTGIETQQKPGLSISKNPGQRKGVLIMKSFLMATLVAAMLVVSFFVGAKMQPGGPGGADEAVRASEESRLSQLEDKLEAVDGLREDVKTLTGLVAELEARTGGETDDRNPAAGGTRGAKSSLPQRESVDESADEEALAAAAEMLKTPAGQEAFDGAVQESVRRYQQEQRQERQRRTGEIRREIEEFKQGPYGKYNLKVNSMAKWLDLNDYQKDVYHTQVARYDALILETRTREKEDPENRDRYGQERKDLRQAFVSVFADALLPDQLEVFNAMSEYETRPDGEERITARVIYGREARADRGEWADRHDRAESDRDETTESTSARRPSRDR